MPSELEFNLLSKQYATKNPEQLYKKVIADKSNIISQADIESIIKEMSKGTYRKKGAISLRSNSLAYPKYLIMPKYSEEISKPFYFEITLKGKVLISYRGNYYLGNVTIESLNIIKDILEVNTNKEDIK